MPLDTQLAPRRRKKLFPCILPGCDKRFTSNSNVRAHLRTLAHVKNRELPWECNDYTTRFARKGDLTRHCESVHSHSKIFRCANCQKYFARKDTLDRLV
ncbi:hypothetical protein B0H63DRAFT_395189 [Podospora didyma]|uniref:C2H2-type domain-containing protein n=1 Tax=Podospora didyma TaxID=330526 RepID=A0AAE0NQT9_9PEZI|nr:hypothetical protein B0H63DRAFT_395189 [Podospora didyma]